MITKTVSELAELCGATLEGDGARTVIGPATLHEAEPDQVSFLGNPRYAAELDSTRAGAVLVPPGVDSPRADMALLRCDNPNRAFSRVIELFRPEDQHQAEGVHPSAVVAPDAVLGAGVSVGPHCVVGPAVTLGDGVVLHPGVVLQRDVSVGAASVLHPCAVVYPGVRIGRGCLIHAGVVLGGDGFGFEPTETGWEKIPQCGTVIVEDDVEIGANSAVDRGRFGATRIGRGAKLDNLVHVAHNVQIGEGALLVAQVGIAGSARVGRRAVLAGQAGVSGHVTIGDGARVGGRGAVVRDIEGGRDYYGNPARPRMEGLRISAAAAKLPATLQRLKELEERVARMERGSEERR